MVIKKLTRLGIILIVAGISLVSVSVLRGSSTQSGGKHGFLLSPLGWSMSEPELWAPRNLRLEVDAEAEVDIYILDGAGIDLWKNSGKLAPLFSFEKAKRGLYTAQLNRRGRYAILIYNPSDSVLEVYLTLTFYGFESDLVSVSIVFGVSGLVIILAKHVSSHAKVISRLRASARAHNVLSPAIAYATASRSDRGMEPHEFHSDCFGHFSAGSPRLLPPRLDSHTQSRQFGEGVCGLRSGLHRLLPHRPPPR